MSSGSALPLGATQMLSESAGHEGRPGYGDGYDDDDGGGFGGSDYNDGDDRSAAEEDAPRSGVFGRLTSFLPGRGRSTAAERDGEGDMSSTGDTLEVYENDDSDNGYSDTKGGAGGDSDDRRRRRRRRKSSLRRGHDQHAQHTKRLRDVDPIAFPAWPVCVGVKRPSRKLHDVVVGVTVVAALFVIFTAAGAPRDTPETEWFLLVGMSHLPLLAVTALYILTRTTIGGVPSIIYGVLPLMSIADHVLAITGSRAAALARVVKTSAFSAATIAGIVVSLDNYNNKTRGRIAFVVAAGGMAALAVLYEPGVVYAQAATAALFVLAVVYGAWVATARGTMTLAFMAVVAIGFAAAALAAPDYNVVLHSAWHVSLAATAYKLYAVSLDHCVPDDGSLDDDAPLLEYEDYNRDGDDDGGYDSASYSDGSGDSYDDGSDYADLSGDGGARSGGRRRERQHGGRRAAR